MIITKTPYRVSLFGGGTDYPEWFGDNAGVVVGASIDKYCYITCRYLPPFFQHKSRIVYSKVEIISDINEIQHPAVREALKYVDEVKGIEIHHDGDLPANSGVGSSSSFTVGLVNALYALRGVMKSKVELINAAIHIEREMAKEVVGWQDQVLTATGGLNVVRFNKNMTFSAEPLQISESRKAELEKYILLVYTGAARLSSDVAASYIQLMGQRQTEMEITHEIAEEAISIITSKRDLSDLGELLHQSWLLKKDRGRGISNSTIDHIYDTARSAGALGGKVIGAGGAGFMMLYARPESHQAIIGKLGGRLCVPIRFEYEGSQVIFNSGGQLCQRNSS